MNCCLFDVAHVLKDGFEMGNNISGITFSGGDPLHPANRAEIKALAMEIKEKYPEKTIWLYTGYLWEEIAEMPIMQYLDVVVEGPFILERRDVKLLWKGSDNQRVVNVRATLHSGDIYKPILHCGDYANE